MRITQLTRKQFDQISLRDLALIVVPLALIAAAAFWFAYQFVKPAPPDWLVLTAGAEGGAYHAFAKRYREILARDSIDVEVRASSGAVENLRRLGNDDAGVDAGFVQSGTGNAEDVPGLVSLGNLYYEPMWVFYRGNAVLGRLSDLRGKRLAIGPPGSGGRKLALQLLSANEAATMPTVLLDLGIPEGTAALRRGEIDAIFIVAGADSPVVQELLRAPGVRLMNLRQAAAYTRLFPFLSSVVLPQGAVNLVRNIPEQDTTLLAVTAMLVAREDLHPALMSLLIQAAIEVHGRPGLFQRPGEFPTAVATDFPMSNEAVRYYKSGPPFLQRYLPFWVAVLVQRMVVLLVPLVVILIPLIRILPSAYSWQVRRRIYRWYGALKQLENELEHDREHAGRAGRAEQLKRLEEIEQRISKLKVPLAFSEEFYNLRQHAHFVRGLITRSQRGDEVTR
jgi:TRAP transporter TAXI family solute receptor